MDNKYRSYHPSEPNDVDLMNMKNKSSPYFDFKNDYDIKSAYKKNIKRWRKDAVKMYLTEKFMKKAIAANTNSIKNLYNIIHRFDLAYEAKYDDGDNNDVRYKVDMFKVRKEIGKHIFNQLERGKN